MMMDQRSSAIRYAHENNSRFLAELQEFLTIPSVSTDPERKADMQRAAEWVAGKMRNLGIENVQIFPTAGHPVVFGHRAR
jgi:acetylornithine deacetylase/succinyl-diaminopimelate desuccinylase-like protein